MYYVLSIKQNQIVLLFTLNAQESVSVYIYIYIRWCIQIRGGVEGYNPSEMSLKFKKKC